MASTEHGVVSPTTSIVAIKGLNGQGKNCFPRLCLGAAGVRGVMLTYSTVAQDLGRQNSGSRKGVAVDE
jgi:hypothetical protein